MKNKILTVMLIIQVICIFAGCANSKIDSEYKQFKDSYMLATGFIDIADKNTSSLEALKKMDANLVKNEMKKMKKIMEETDKQANSKYERGLYSSEKRSYQGIEIMLHAYENLDNLSDKDESDVDNEVILAKVLRDDIVKNDEL